MKLLQELADREQFNEGVLAGDQTRMKKMFDTLEQNINRVGSQLKKDSQFAKQVAKVEGDTKHLNSIIKKFDALYDEIHDLIMYTSMHMDGEEM